MKKMNPGYYFIIMSQQELLKNEVIEEILRERAMNYQLNKKPVDFWVSLSPLFIYDYDKKILNQIRETAYYEKEVDNICFKYSNITFEYFASIITCDPEFVKWFKLRVGDFEDIQKKENKKDAPTYNGIYGEIPATSTFDLLDDDPTYLHPFIFIERYKVFLEAYYSTQYLFS
jgi:hypothetical protein